MTSQIESLKTQMLETIEDAMCELNMDEYLLFLGWVEAAIRGEQEIALAVRKDLE